MSSNGFARQMRLEWFNWITTVITELVPSTDRGSGAIECARATTQCHREWNRMRGGGETDISRPDPHLQSCALLRGECSIAAVSGADGVGAHDTEMISRVRSQSRDVRGDVLVIIAGLDLVGRS